ncbi:MAG TPA: hypothetical protein PLQ54_18255, partial [Armatimonadota bacterium]|nr:hypothetical protein [Armatimonadota bacterium]
MRLLLTSMIAGSLWSAPVGAGPDAQLVGPLTFEPATPAPIVSPGLPGPAGAPLDLRPAPAGPFDGSSGSAPCRRPAADGALYWAGVDHSAQAAEMLETAA